MSQQRVKRCHDQPCACIRLRIGNGVVQRQMIYYSS